MASQRQNGANAGAVEEMVLRLFQGQGYTVSRGPEGSASPLALLQRGEQRVLLRFLWGHQEWGEEQVHVFRTQMEDLKAAHGYLFTNGLFSASAQEAAPQLSVSLGDGATLREVLFNTAPLLQRAGLPEEQPLPFAKYIPWFVGVSLVLLVIVVMALVSIALSQEPVPTS